MFEDVARTVHIARQLGEPGPDRRRPTSTPSTTATRTSTASSHTEQRSRDDIDRTARSGSSPAARTCTATRRCARSPTQSQADRGRARRRRRHARARSSWKPVLTDADAIRRVLLDANADDRVRRRDRLDAHLLARPRCGSPGSTRCASRCCTCTPRPTSSCPGPTIDMDFMNLNQAAHGDREFGYIADPAAACRARPWSGHVADPVVAQRVGDVGARGRRPRPRCARCGWPASATTCATSRSPRATRSRPSSASASRSTPTASTTWSPRSTRSPTPTSTRWSPSTTTPTTSRAELRRGGDRHESLRYGARIEAGLRQFLEAGGFTAFTTNFEDLGGLRQLPGLAVQRLMADGYGFGGEGDWKTAVLRAHPQGDGRGPAGRHVVHGGLHLPPRARRAS